MALFAPFRPSNAIVVAYDHLEGAGIEDMEAQLDEVGRYYRFVKLSEIVDRHRRRSIFRPTDGLAAVVFKEARKSLFQRAIPSLRGRRIPITVFLHSDCVGLTRLPLEEELALYRRYHPDAFPGETEESLAERAWKDPLWGEAAFAEARKNGGPFPLGELDPMRFFVVWGQFRDIPPDLIEFGLRLPAAPLSTNRDRLGIAKAFVESRIGAPLTLAGAPRRLTLSSTNEEAETLRSLGFSACVHTAEGIIDDKTEAFQLPQWRFAQNDG